MRLRLSCRALLIIVLVRPDLSFTQGLPPAKCDPDKDHVGSTHLPGFDMDCLLLPAVSTMKVKCSKLLMLVIGMMRFNHCNSQTISSSSDIIYPFGSTEGDKVVAIGDNNCDGPVYIPLNTFSSSNRLFVRILPRLLQWHCASI